MGDADSGPAKEEENLGGEEEKSVSSLGQHVCVY